MVRQPNIRASEWDGVSYGYGRGRAHPCVSVACPVCGAVAGALCLGGKGRQQVPVFSCHSMRNVDYRAAVREGRVARVDTRRYVLLEHYDRGRDDAGMRLPLQEVEAEFLKEVLQGVAAQHAVPLRYGDAGRAHYLRNRIQRVLDRWRERRG